MAVQASLVDQVSCQTTSSRHGLESHELANDVEMQGPPCLEGGSGSCNTALTPLDTMLSRTRLQQSERWYQQSSCLYRSCI